MGPYSRSWGPAELLGSAFGVFILVLGLASIVLAVVVWWRIFAKAGYSGALGLLMFVPLANLIVLLVLAFGTWPIEEEVRRLRGGGQ
jgi:hypothetical protein